MSAGSISGQIIERDGKKYFVTRAGDEHIERQCSVTPVKHGGQEKTRLRVFDTEQTIVGDLTLDMFVALR
jgi:hypothetical protein